MNKKEVIFIKRIFSCFIIAILMIVFSFPLTVSADSHETVNLNDSIYICFLNEWNAFEFDGSDNMRFLQSPFVYWEIDTLDFFFYAYLLNCGYDYTDDSIFRDDYLVAWREAVDADIVSRDCSFVVDAVDELVCHYYYGMQNFSLGVLDRPIIAFSADFVSIFNDWVDLYFTVNGLEKSDEVIPLKATSYTEGWYNDSSVTYVFFSQVEFGEGTYSLLPQHVVLEPVYDHQIVDDYELNQLREIWDTVIGFIDIRRLTSWLPDKLSAPIIIYFSIFLTLTGVLVILKLKG